MRLKPLRESDLDADQAALFEALVSKSVRRSDKGVLDERGAARGPLGVLLHHPPSGRPLQQLSSVLRFEGLLSDAAREAVILVVAAHWHDGHEWSSHEPLAREAGIGDAQLEALKQGHETRFDDPETQAAYEMARAIVEREDLSDAEFERVRAALSQDRLVEVTVVVAYYALLSMQLRVFRVPGPSF